jgi:hypothetical protein
MKNKSGGYTVHIKENTCSHPQGGGEDFGQCHLGTKYEKRERKKAGIVLKQKIE